MLGRKVKVIEVYQIAILKCFFSSMCFILKYITMYIHLSIKGPLNYKYILTSVDVYESIHHKIITC